MKTYTFELPDDEAAVMDETIATLRYAYPDLTREDGIKVLVRMGWADAVRRLTKMSDPNEDSHAS